MIKLPLENLDSLYKSQKERKKKGPSSQGLFQLQIIVNK